MSLAPSIPQQLDEPFKFILWTVDDLAALFIPFLVLLLGLNSPITGLLMGGMLLFFLKKVKGEQGHYFLYHVMYWYLPNVFHFKKTPPSSIRDYIG